jgi:hypothetical protein
MNVLFWNLKGKDLGQIIVELVGKNSIDLIILAEAKGINNTQFVQKLSSEFDGPYGFHYSPGQTKLRVFSRFPSTSIINLEESGGAIPIHSRMKWSIPKGCTRFHQDGLQRKSAEKSMTESGFSCIIPCGRCWEINQIRPVPITTLSQHQAVVFGIYSIRFCSAHPWKRRLIFRN